MKQEHKYSMFLRTSFLSFSKNLHCFLVTRGIQGLSSFVSTALEVYKAHHRSTALLTFSQFCMDMQVLTSSQGNTKKNVLVVCCWHSS